MKNKSVNKEDLILDAALKIFEQKGFNAATTSEIAKEAGIAEGTIFRYFKTKKDILRSIQIKAIEIFAPQVISKPVKILKNSENKSEKEIMKEILKERVMFATEHFPIAKIVLTEALLHDDIRQSILDNIVLKAKSIFDEFFDKMAAEGKFRNVDKMCAMRLFIGSFITLVGYQYLFNVKFSKDDLDREVDKTVDILLNGLISSDRKGSEV